MTLPSLALGLQYIFNSDAIAISFEVYDDSVLSSTLNTPWFYQLHYLIVVAQYLPYQRPYIFNL